MSTSMADLFAPLLDKLPPWARGLSRRFRLSLAFIGLLGLIALIGYPFASGEIDAERQRLNQLRAAMSSANAEANEARREYEYVTANTPRFEQALERDILAPQDRLAARQILDDLYYRHYLVSLNYEFSQARFLPANDTHEVVSTPITLQTGAMLDRDILSMLRSLERTLPGYPVFRSIALRGVETINEADLVSITAGTPVPLFQAEVRLDWRTARLRPVGPSSSDDEDEDYEDDDDYED